ncbi:group I truncated hemoglobin [Kaarinaea lacus]
MKQTLFEAVGGLPTLRRVHKIFYDKVYAHPWLGQFFIGHNQEAIENRQTSFMAQKMGGDVNYWGKDPKMAHRAMYITDELFDLRADLLEESLIEVGVPEALRQRWLKIDNAFRRQIVKTSVEAFYKTTWKYEKRVFVNKPDSENSEKSA